MPPCDKPLASIPHCIDVRITLLAMYITMSYLDMRCSMDPHYHALWDMRPMPKFLGYQGDKATLSYETRETGDSRCPPNHGARGMRTLVVTPLTVDALVLSILIIF